MKTLTLFSLIITMSMISLSLHAQELDKFKADLGKKTVMGKDIRVPYQDVVSYYGYVKPGTKADEERGGKKYYYLYVWIPAVAPELGIRMISPVPEKLKPLETDFVNAEYKANESDRTTFFDTWISFEKAEGITSIDQVATKGKTAKWNSIDQNDDSSEMPTQPSGNKYNSLMRLTSETSNPLKALSVGLYRIGFTTYKTGEVQGGFAAQIGSPVKLPGVMISNTLAGVAQ